MSILLRKNSVSVDFKAPYDLASPLPFHTLLLSRSHYSLCSGHLGFLLWVEHVRSLLPSQSVPLLTSQTFVQSLHLFHLGVKQQHVLAVLLESLDTASPLSMGLTVIGKKRMHLVMCSSSLQ